MDILKVFTTRGRLARKPFAIALGVSFLAVFVASFSAGLLPAALSSLTTLLIAALYVFFDCSITVRRLHDVGRSGYWLLIFFVANNVVAILFQTFFQVLGPPSFWGFVVLAYFIAVVIYSFTVLFDRGDPNVNQYGPAPNANIGWLHSLVGGNVSGSELTPPPARSTLPTHHIATEDAGKRSAQRDSRPQHQTAFWVAVGIGLVPLTLFALWIFVTVLSTLMAG